MITQFMYMCVEQVERGSRWQGQKCTFVSGIESNDDDDQGIGHKEAFFILEKEKPSLRKKISM